MEFLSKDQKREILFNQVKVVESMVRSMGAVVQNDTPPIPESTYQEWIQSFEKTSENLTSLKNELDKFIKEDVGVLPNT